MLRELDSESCSSVVVDISGDKFLYIEVLNVLYGMLETALF
jgi:hypothetical protein